MIDPATDALLIVDVQNDFCPDGALAVPEGHEVVSPLNRYAKRFAAAGAAVFATRDWHPERTKHFAEHGGVWPPHCVQGTPGAQFHPDLELPAGAIVVSKGMDPDEDAYSAFHARDHHTRSFAEILAARGIRRIFVGGLATDYCVKATTLDAVRHGLEVIVLEDAVGAVNLAPEDGRRAIEEMRAAGARFPRGSIGCERVISSVTVFCGSSNLVDDKYFDAARDLGDKLARRKWRLVYGGGSVGLMGVLARAVLDGGGHVTGVIPKMLLDLGVGERGVSELIVTDGLRDRKAIMDERGDAFVALPGGLGTLEEVLEVMTLKQLGFHRKAVAVLDLDGYFDPLWTQIQRGIDQGFIKPEYLDLWYPAPDVDALLRYLESYEPHRYGPKWTVGRGRTS